jgi:nucleoside 2-deoxyribosyltransferase
MSSAAAYIAILPIGANGLPMATSGTCVELGWASALQIPIAILWDEARSEAYGHLIRGLHVVASVRYIDLAECIDNPAAITDALMVISPWRQ